MRVIKVQTVVWKCKDTATDNQKNTFATGRTLNEKGEYDITDTVGNFYDNQPLASVTLCIDNKFKPFVRVVVKFDCVPEGRTGDGKEINSEEIDYVDDAPYVTKILKDTEIQVKCEKNAERYDRTLEVKSAKWKRKEAHKNTVDLLDGNSKEPVSNEEDVTLLMQENTRHNLCRMISSGVVDRSVMQLELTYRCVEGLCPHYAFFKKHIIPDNVIVNGKVDLSKLSAHVSVVERDRRINASTRKLPFKGTQVYHFFQITADTGNFRRTSKEACRFVHPAKVYRCKLEQVGTKLEWKCVLDGMHRVEHCVFTGHFIRISS